MTGAADGTAARAPLRGELEKARRHGRLPARVELARAVREAAMAADGAESFIAGRMTSWPGPDRLSDMLQQIAASRGLDIAARPSSVDAFAVEVRDDAGPSIVSEDYRVEWLLRAVIDRPLRRDEVWEQTIAAHTS